MEFIFEENRIYAEDATGKLIAEVTFPDRSENTVEINHTFEDESLRGQGVASQLMEAAVQKLNDEKKKVIPTCPYAVKWFESHPKFADIQINP